jgi:hypothetical protein
MVLVSEHALHAVYAAVFAVAVVPAGAIVVPEVAEAAVVPVASLVTEAAEGTDAVGDPEAAGAAVVFEIPAERLVADAVVIPEAVAATAVVENAVVPDVAVSEAAVVVEAVVMLEAAAVVAEIAQVGLAAQVGVVVEARNPEDTLQSFQLTLDYMDEDHCQHHYC